MQIYEELVARGLIAQVTNEEEIKKMVNEGKAVFYIGFDPTADSLHVGHFMALGSLTAEQMKNPYRPHKAYIFLSSFLIFYVAICGYVWYNKA